MVSAFFRGGTFMAESLDFTVERTGDPLILSVISAGCGPGYEVDSMVCLYKEGGYGGRIAVEAYDFNTLAIHMAQLGRYMVHNRYNFDGVPAQEIMSSLGFTVEEKQRDDRKEGTFQVDASPIREGAQVTIIEHDLSKPLPRKRPAHLILANNLLQHLRRPGTVVPVVRNLASLLADRGVFSIGEPITREATPEGQVATTLLQEEFGLEPLFYGPSGQPTMFGRC
jgi:chemotaxis methyl-accepting protein methylase